MFPSACVCCVVVYTYSRNPLVAGGWSRVGAALTPNGSRSQFGTALALSADASTLVVGASLDNGTGAVYIYTAPPSTGLWSLQRKIDALEQGFAPVNTYNDVLFGYSVALSAAGDTLAVAVPGSAAEAVVIYGRDGTGTWTNQSGWIKANPSSILFGWSLGMNAAGDALAIGAPFDNVGATYAGGVFTIIRSPVGVWGPLRRVVIEDSIPTPIRQIGIVSMSAQGTLVVGGPGEEPTGAWRSAHTHSTRDAMRTGCLYL